MLTKEQIQANKDEFCALIRSIERDGVESLISKLDSCGFFTAPASTVYHGAYDGGLCEHSLNVYKDLVVQFHSHFTEQDGKYYKGTEVICSDDSLKVVGLLHDLCKMTMYEKYKRNEQQLINGRYEWVKVDAFKVRAPENRFLFSTHGHNSEYMAGSLISLTFDESRAIANHMGMDSEVALRDQSFIYTASPLSMFLHVADTVAANFVEGCYNASNH